MDRRDFVKNSLLTWGSLALPRYLEAKRMGGGSSQDPSGDAKFQVEYIRDNIPPFEIPPYRGQSYEDRVPDTLDIAERARLTIHCLTSIADPAADYEVYWAANFFQNPPIMAHDFNDWVLVCESMQEDLPLLRLATGDDLNSQVDPAWAKVLLKCLGPDGLMYVPFKGRPWSRLRGQEMDPVWRADGSKTTSADMSVTQATSGELSGKALGVLTVYYLRDGNPMWKQAAEQLIQRLSALAVNKGDYCYMSGAWEPNAKVGPDAEMPLSAMAEEWDARVIQTLSQYYKATGYEPALEFATKLTRFFRDHAQCYDEQGRFLWSDAERGWLVKPYSSAGQRIGGHGGSHIFGLFFLLEYAIAVNDRDTMQFVKTSFEWAKDPGTGFGVSPLVGWFPEWYLAGYPTCETCCVADMIDIALHLSLAGVGDYWDDVDRWVRNQFAEQQLTSVDWIYRTAQRRPRKPVDAYATAERAAESNLGGFGGWATGSDWGSGIMHCCTGNGGRALYYLWENMVQRKGGELRVNLLLNHASEWADVYSYVPYQGRVDLKVKKACERVLVHAPEWIRSGSPEIACNSTSKDVPKQLGWEGRYVNLGAAKPGEVLSVTFPISERTVQETMGLVRYKLTIKGNTVVAIDPPGGNGPLYQDRTRYRSSEVQWREVKRFVPDQQILW